MCSTVSFWKAETRISFVSSFFDFSAISISLSQIAATTVDFPVPGGPWITATSGVLIAISTASFWFWVKSLIPNFSFKNFLVRSVNAFSLRFLINIASANPSIANNKFWVTNIRFSLKLFKALSLRLFTISSPISDTSNLPLSGSVSNSSYKSMLKSLFTDFTRNRLPLSLFVSMAFSLGTSNDVFCKSSLLSLMVDFKSSERLFTRIRETPSSKWRIIAKFNSPIFSFKSVALCSSISEYIFQRDISVFPFASSALIVSMASFALDDSTKLIDG